MRRPLTIATTLLVAGLASTAPALEWVQLSPEGPLPPLRAYTTAAYDSQRHRMLIFGGETAGGRLNDVWAYDIAGNTWEELTPESGSMPVERKTALNVYDAAGDRMLMWSGQSNVFHNDTWAFDLVNNNWTEYSPPPPVPDERYGVAGIFDPVGGDLVTFAGFTNSGRFDDTQRFNAAAGAWTDVSPGQNPVERCLHSASYDSQQHRMIMYGGQMSGPLGDIWAFDLDAHTWEELTPVDSPPGRFFPTQVYDVGNHRALVFGGHRGGGGGGKTNEVWSFDLDGEAWELLSPSGTAPSERDGSASIYVPGEDRMLIFGGRDNSYKDDLWSLEGLSEESSVGDEDGFARSALVLTSHPNPAPGATTLTFTLEVEDRAILQVFDVKGRRIRTLLSDRRGAGPVSVDWDGRTDLGDRVPQGVYFVSLRSSTGRARTRIAILP